MPLGVREADKFMKTEMIKLEGNRTDEEKIRRAGEIIKRGGLVAFPTETVYGLGGDALKKESSRKIYEAKGRPSDNPLIVHICKWGDIEGITRHVPESAKQLAEIFWPGPLTMILEKSEIVPKETTGGLDTVAIRMPEHKAALLLIEASGGYVAAPSANTSGRPSPTLAGHVKEDMDGKVDMILDGGPVGIGVESTIVDLTEKKPVILRPGYITKEMLEEILETEVLVDKAMQDAHSGQAPKAPGMKYRHYAPKGSLTVVDGSGEQVIKTIRSLVKEKQAEGERVGVICTDETAEQYEADVIKSAGSKADEEEIAAHLYAVLRELDEEGATVIYSEAFSDKGVGRAVMNRLLKAAGHHILYV